MFYPPYSSVLDLLTTVFERTLQSVQGDWCCVSTSLCRRDCEQSRPLLPNEQTSKCCYNQQENRICAKEKRYISWDFQHNARTWHALHSACYL